MKRFAPFAFLLAASAAQAQTTFTAGDLAIVGYNSSNPDDVAVVSLVDFTAGTSFYMTDYGWRSANDGWRGGGEGWAKLTATRNFSAGEVFVVRRENTGFSTLTGNDFTYEYDGTSLNTGTPQFAPNGTGDQVFLFQGNFTDSTTTSTPATLDGTMIFGLNAEGAAAGANGWQANATGSQDSALPSTLTEGTTAVGLFPNNVGEAANAFYSGTLRSGTKAQLLTLIADRTNWTVQADLKSFDTSRFNVAPVPEPASMLALGAGAVGLLRRRRRRRA